MSEIANLHKTIGNLNAQIERLKSEVTEKHKAYEIAFEQAMVNGQRAIELKAELDQFRSDVEADKKFIQKHVKKMESDIVSLESDKAELVAALEDVCVKEINGHDFDKLVNQLLELSKQYGGWQNCYMLNAVLAFRAKARETLAKVSK